MKRFALILFLLESALLSQAQATLVPFTPTTTLLPRFGSFYTVNEINDGSTASLNGFVTSSAAGTISLNVNTPPKSIDALTLFNDVNILREGVREFHLDFFSGATNVGTTPTFTALQALPMGQKFTFPTVHNVSRVDLVVHNSHTTASGAWIEQIEIREVQLHCAVPEPSSLAMAGVGALGFVYRRRRRKAALET